MRYYFKASDELDEDSKFTNNKGTLFEITNKGRKKIRSLELSSKTCPKIRGAVICQRVAEGSAITEIVKSNSWSPSEVEFFVWLKKHRELLDWYQDALRIRDQVTVDKTYSKLKNLDYGAGEQAEKVVGVLKELKDIMKKRDTDGFKDSIQVHSPVIKDWSKFREND